MRYTERIQRDFTDDLRPTAVATIAAAILAADESGYRPREALLADLVQSLLWCIPPEVTRLRTHCDIWFSASSVAREGLVETLTALHAQGIRLGVVANGVVRRQQPKIETLQLRSYLSTVVISEAVQVERPDQHIFAHVLAAMGCQASQAWFVGDHPINDVRGATASGLRPIWLTGVHPWPTDHPEPQCQIGALSEIMAMVQHERNATT